MAVNQLQLKVLIQRIVNRGSSARVVDIDGATPEVNLLKEATYDGGVEGGPIEVELAISSSKTVTFGTVIGGSTKKILAVMSDNPVQIGVDGAAAGPDVTLYVSTPNAAVGYVILKNNSTTLTVTAKVFVYGTT